MDVTAVTVEACVVSVSQPGSCFEAGAHRVELCRDLSVGGLTPESDQIRAAVADARGPVHVLLRPRADGFRVGRAGLDALLEEVSGVVGLGVADRPSGDPSTGVRDPGSARGAGAGAGGMSPSHGVDERALTRPATG